MKRAYIEVGLDNLPINVDIQCAIDGLSALDYQIIPIEYGYIVRNSCQHLIRESPIICSFTGMKMLFNSNNIEVEPIDYPDEIKDYLSRSIILTSIKDILSMYKKGTFRNNSNFIKPYETKIFDGFVLNRDNLNILEGFDKNCKVWVSPKIDIESEWRIFVHKKEIVHASCYTGNFRISPDYTYIDNIISSYKNSPVSYTIDIGILKKDSTLSKIPIEDKLNYKINPNDVNVVIEINDFWGIGSYGINPTKYAEMLIDRYFEIVKG